MFYYLRGKLAHVTQTYAVLDVGGVGYRLTVSGNTYSKLPMSAIGKFDAPDTLLYTHMAVREDGIELFGFIDENELSSFKMLLSVSGVGPKAAISILTQLSPEKFALAVCTEDKKAISAANGIGPKTAARIILELKDKLLKETSDGDLASAAYSDAPVSQGASTGKSGKMREALDALMVLGYGRSEAQNVLSGIDTSTLSIEDIIKTALKKLM